MRKFRTFAALALALVLVASSVSVVSGQTGANTAAETDLAITKADSADPVNPGDDFTYTLTVTNQGPLDATNVVVTDVLPAGVTFVSADSVDYDEATGAWTVGGMVNTASATLNIVVTAGAETTQVSNTATATADQADPDASNNEAVETTDINGADLSIAKADSADPVNPGDDFTYTITVTNQGPLDATNVVVTDVLPAGVTFVSADSVDYDEATGAWTIGGLVNSASATLNIVVTAGAETTQVSNTATATADQADPDASNNEAVETTDINGADLSITKADSADPVNPGDDFTYTITVTNQGPLDATNVVVTDVLPAGVTFVSADSVDYDEATGAWTVGGLVNSASATLNIVVTAGAETTQVSNTATATADQADPDASNNEAVETTDINGADLSITKADSADPVNPGDDFTYTITVTNQGPLDATNVVVTDVLPAGVTFVSADSVDYEEATGAWTIGGLVNGASATLNIVVTTGAETTQVSNTATATADQADPDASNNEAVETTDIGEPDTAATPRLVKEEVLEALEGFANESKRFQKALRELTKSLASELWVDDLHLDSRHGHKVFSRERHAIRELMHAIDKSSKSPKRQLSAAAIEEAMSAIAALVSADRELAAVALDEMGGDSKALERLASGDARRDEGDFDKAVKDYRKAWKQALSQWHGGDEADEASGHDEELDIEDAGATNAGPGSKGSKAFGGKQSNSGPGAASAWQNPGKGKSFGHGKGKGQRK